MPTEDEDGTTTHERECSCRLCCYIRARLSPTPLGVEWYAVVRYARRHGHSGTWIINRTDEAATAAGNADENNGNGVGSGVSVTTASGETTVEQVAGPITDDDMIDFAAAISGWNGNTQ